MNYSVYISGFGKEDDLVDEMFLGKFEDYSTAADYAHDIYDNPDDYLSDLNHRDRIITFEVGVYHECELDHLVQEYSLRKYV